MVQHLLQQRDTLLNALKTRLAHTEFYEVLCRSHGARSYNVFHVSILKTFKGQVSSSYMPILMSTNEEALMLCPDKVLDVHILQHGSMKIPQVLIMWQHVPLTDATWEDVAVIQQAFPSFNLEDKVIFRGIMLL